MFPSSKPDYLKMDNKQLLIIIIEQLDEVKRYAANTYANTDTEVDDLMKMMRRLENQLSETDRQVDKIERFERGLNDIKSTLKSMERKIR